MENKNLSKVHRLWIGVLGTFFCWHVGFSIAQTPGDTAIVANSTVSAGQAIEQPVIIPAVAIVPANEQASQLLPAVDLTHPNPVQVHSSAVQRVSYVSRSAPFGMDWATTVSNARINLRPELLPDPSQAEQSVEQAADQLQKFLSRANDERFPNWLAFLQWNDLQEQLRSSEPDVNALIQLERNMRQNFVGLELAQFVRLRESLNAYIAALRFGQDKSSSLEMIRKRLDQLSETLQTPANGADSVRQREIGLIASILAQSKQSPDLLQTVRSQFSRPNVRVLVSSEFVQRQFSRPVSTPNPVNEVILGTRILGQSSLTGSVTPQLVDNPINASLRLILSAHMSTSSIGTNRNVKIHSKSSSNIVACETISLTENGFVSNSDTSVSAPLQSTITGIDHRLRIVRKIASKKVAEQKPLADSIAQGRLETRVRNDYHRQLQEQLDQSNVQLRDKAMPILERLGLPKPKRTSWSSGQYLTMLWKQQDQDQLAASSSCPLSVMPQGITIQLHQSAIMNMIDPVIAGRVIHHDDLDDIAKQIGQPPSDKLKEEVSGEAWSIDMAGYHPIEVEFDDQIIRFRIRTTKLDRGDQALEQPASIEAAYKVILQNGTIQLERQGDVAIDFAGKAQRGIRAVTLRSFLKNKFDTVFKPTLLDKPFRLSDRLPPGTPNLNVVDLQIDDGWIQATLM